jgi:hypothetical protein
VSLTRVDRLKNGYLRHHDQVDVRSIVPLDRIKFHNSADVDRRAYADGLCGLRTVPARPRLRK